MKSVPMWASFVAGSEPRLGKVPKDLAQTGHQNQIVSSGDGCSKSATKNKGVDESVDRLRGLQEDLVIEILQRVPLSALFSLRCVSKHWNSILNSPTFLRMCTEQCSKRPPLFFQAVDYKTNFAVYNNESARWNSCHYSSLLPKSFKSLLSPEKTIIKAAMSGLFLLEELGSIGTWFLMNPSNKSYKKLPVLEDMINQMGTTHFSVMGMHVNTPCGDCKVLVQATALFVLRMDRGLGIHEPCPRRSCHMYYEYELRRDSWKLINDESRTLQGNSADDSWEAINNRYLENARASHFGLGAPDPRFLPAVFRQDFWYYISHARGHDFFHRNPTPNVVRFKTGVAEEIEAPLPREDGLFLQFLNLFERDDRLLIAGGGMRKDHKLLREWTSFHIWQLDEVQSEWIELVRVPQQMLHHFSYGQQQMRYPLDLGCGLVGDHLCIWALNYSGSNVDNYRGDEAEMQSSREQLNFFISHNQGAVQIDNVRPSGEANDDDDYDSYEKIEMAICDLRSRSWRNLRLNSETQFPGSFRDVCHGKNTEHLANFLFYPNFCFFLPDSAPLQFSCS